MPSIETFPARKCGGALRSVLVLGCEECGYNKICKAARVEALVCEADRLIIELDDCRRCADHRWHRDGTVKCDFDPERVERERHREQADIIAWMEG